MIDFFKTLKPMHAFLDFSNSAFYTKAPEDSCIVITDVEGSTKAIESGKYKWVNVAGASSIVAIVNAIGTKDFPFVFGGDGATAVIPMQDRDRVEKYLRAARINAKTAFDLNLRIGIIPLKDIKSEGAEIEIARYAMNPGPSIAFFKGDGLALAEKWVKSGRGLIGEGEVAPLDETLKGLSCRWAPLNSTRGVMVSLIVKPKSNDTATLQRVAAEINKIVDLDAPETHPVKERSFRPEKMLKAALAEARLQDKRPLWLGVLNVAIQMILVRIFVRFKLNAFGFNAPKYTSSMTSHSDFRKYDEMLRMVIDCKPDMKDKIRSYLESEYRSGMIHFGMHESDSALITCFLQSHDDGGHIHFIDGSDGGYALAAKELKSQLKRS